MLLGHVNDFENDSWKVLPHLKDWYLTRTNDKFKLISNICPHQGSYLKGTKGKNTRLCPYHGWSFNADGSPISSGTTEHWCKNNEHLESKDVYIWNNYIFSEKPDFPDIDYIDSSHLKLEQLRIDKVEANYKDIVGIFLDMDHLPVVHPKIYDQLQLLNVEWELRSNGSIQYAPNNNEFESEYTKTMMPEDRDRKVGAAWFCTYPYSMLEYFPGAWFNTVCNPVSEKLTMVSVYKYRDIRYSEKNWKLNEEIWETAWYQDVHQSQLMKPNYKTKHLEDSKKHYHSWLDKNGLQ